MKHRITWLYEVLKDYPQPSCFFFTLKHEPGARRNSLCPPPPPPPPQKKLRQNIYEFETKVSEIVYSFLKYP